MFLQYFRFFLAFSISLSIFNNCKYASFICLFSICFIFSGCSLKDEKSVMISEDLIKDISSGDEIVIKNFRNDEIKKLFLIKMR